MQDKPDILSLKRQIDALLILQRFQPLLDQPLPQVREGILPTDAAAYAKLADIDQHYRK